MELHTYFRSSASYRVRIALALKGLQPQERFIHLTRGGGMQHSEEFARVNPARLVPVLQDGNATIPQSLAILEYLEEIHPSPAMLPAHPADRAWVRALALQIACEIHPLNNLRVLQYLERDLHLRAEQKQAWIAHWITLGFSALEAQLANSSRTGSCCFGDAPTLADCCLVPQMFNARRFGIKMDAYPTLVRIDHHLTALETFRRASPEAQPDAE